MDDDATMTTSTTSLVTSSQVKVPTMDALAAMSIGGTNKEYQRGLITIGAITFLFASNSPALHAVFTETSPPPVLLVNAAISSVALVGLLFGGSALESSTPLPSTLKEEEESVAIRAGLELGLWKFLGTTANLAGLSMTTADHGAFLIQLTTLIVPVVQGIMGVPIPRRIQFSVLLALCGVALFTQDVSESASHASALGDTLCVVAAGFYATYDLRLFSWGKRVAPRKLITGKIATQALFSMLLLAACGYQDTMDYATTLSASPEQLKLVIPVILWSGIAVNAVAPFLQVGGQQAVGPTRCQTIYASQPLWAGIMSFFFLGETVGMQGLAGGVAFLSALFLAATSEAPDPDCGQMNCEV
jgi:drug/metabolite transporter (DMT)-like permease